MLSKSYTTHYKIISTEEYIAGDTGETLNDTYACMNRLGKLMLRTTGPWFTFISS